MIVHLFPKSQFVEDYIFFVNQNFNMDNHCFILYTNGYFELAEELYQIENVFDFDKKGIKWLLEMLKEADKIILHNISVTLPILIRLYLNKRIVRKSIWVIWGGDLYCYRAERVKLVDKFVEYMRAAVIKNVACVATLTEGDYTLAHKWYHIDKRHIRVDYFSYRGAKILSELPRNVNDNNIYRLMIGNSATATNHHIEVFETVEDIITKKWEVVVPLSYGDDQYRDLINSEGIRRFGDSFRPVFQYMDKAQYFDLLHSIDVAAFNNDRQQATGNIMALAYLGKRIYMRTDTTMWEEFVDKQGFVMFDIKKLAEDLRCGIVSLTSKEVQHNLILAEQYYSIDDRIKEWNVCFEIEL